MLNYDRRGRVEDHRVAAFFQAQLEAGESYASITAARKAIAQELGRAIAPGTPEAKAVDEVIELALVNVSRKLVKDASPIEAFDKLVDLYNRQPTLGVRSSTSARQQAYSTVLPIAYLVSQLAGISKSSRVYEPTAGNGALLIGADPKSCTVNELNSDRAAQLRSQGFSVTEHDATEYLPEEKHDVVIANPPFGRVKGKRFRLPGNPRGTSQIDQAIAMQALQAMKDDGRAVLIMGGKPEIDPEQRSEAYNSLETRGFFYTLHQQYNITDHFTINGDLYRKQGAGWPIDIILIEGKGESMRPLPAVEPPRIYNSFEELRGYLIDYLRQNPERQGLRRDAKGLDTAARESGDVRRASTGQLDLAHIRDLPGTDEASSGLDDTGVVELRPKQDRAGTDAQANLETAQSGSGEPRSAGVRRGREADMVVGERLGGQPSGVRFNLERVVSSDQPRDRVSRGPDPLSDTSISRNAAQRIEHRRLPDRTENPILLETSSETPMSEEFNIPYQPKSQGRSPGTLIPKNMAIAAQKALLEVEAKYGNIDAFVQQRLGYRSKANMYERLYAEQIDSLALAFSQRDQGQCFLNGDQTGNGKGRFGAANIIDAKRQGYISIFVTQRPNLYAAMLEDIADIGFDGLKPFMTNVSESLTLQNGTTLTTGDAASQEAEMYRIAQSDNLGGYDVIFTTYNQLQTVAQKEPYRRDFLRALAPNAVFIFDEAHEAGGGSVKPRRGELPNRAQFVRELVDTAAGVVHLSATATKHPAVMDLYARRTDAVHAVPSMIQLENTLRAGGIPLQQMMAVQFVSAGNLLRRERSFENISFDAKEVHVDHQVADGISAVMRAVARFDEEKQKSVAKIRKRIRKEAKSLSEDKSIGRAGAKSVNFTSLMHNAIEQGLLSQKAEATVQEAIAALERGEKPLITVSNTMDAFIGQYAASRGIKAGDSINVTFGDVLDRYLERSRDVLITDYDGNSERERLADDELSTEAFNAFQDAKEAIAATDFSRIPLSSIDYVKYRLEQAGYRVDEITGRSNVIEYNNSGMTLGLRNKRETTSQAKIEIVNRFNSGQLDVVILNRSGATGISLHASEKFSDQRPRHMIVAQPERDINQMMQMLGRANRFGQVVEPKFTLVMADVPAEKRMGAILSRKMASLNANTTAARESDLSIGNVADIMNVAGEEVILTLLEENIELEAKLSYPSKTKGEIVEAFTGRIPLLPIAEQEMLYEVIEAETKELIKQKEAMGENVLQADRLDLEAKTVSMMEVEAADTQLKSAFTGPVLLEVVDAKVINKPPTQLEVINTVRAGLGMVTIAAVSEHRQPELENVGLDKAEQAVASLEKTVDDYKQQLATKLKSSESQEKQITTVNEQIGLFQQKVKEFSPGTTVVLRTREEDITRVTYGVVTDFKQKARIMGSPAAGSNWKIQVMTHDGKLLSIPFSKINNGKPFGLQIEARPQTLLGKNILQEFDRLQQAQRTQMQVFTGNLLKAYQTFPQGKFVNFTNDQGQVRQGLLMDEEFNIVEKLQEFPVEFHEPQQVKTFIETLTYSRGPVESHDGHLVIVADTASRLNGTSPEYYVVRVPKSTQDGGQYFLSEELTQAADSDFYSVGGRMEMRVEPEDLDEVVKVIMTKLDTKLVVSDPSYKEILRNHLGETLPVLQAIEPITEKEALQTQSGSQVGRPVESSTISLAPPPVSTPQPEQAIAAVQSEATTPIDQALPPAPSKGTISDVDKDTVEQAIAKEGSKDIIEGTQLSLLSTEASAIPTENIKPQVTESDLNPNPEPAIAKDKSETISQEQSVVTARVLPPSQQGSQAAKNVAKLLHDAGLQSLVLKGEDFHLRAEQDHFLPFVIERHHNYDSRQDQLYLTHYNSMNGDQFIDAEMVFNIGDRGNLSLAETASFNPFTGGELRNKDHSFAKLFSGNLLAQGWAQAISKTREDLKAETVETKVLKPQSPENPALDAVQQPNSNNVQDGLNPKDWPIVAAAVGRNPDYIERVRQVVQSPLQATAQSAMQKDFVVYQKTLEGLREWYAHARAIQKPSLYLHEIHAIATKFQAGEKLKPEIRALARQDWSELHFKKFSRGVHHSPDTFLKDVANNALAIGLDAQKWKAMSFKDISDILIQGNPGLRDTFKLHRDGTTRYVKTTLVEVIKQLPQEKRKALLKSDPAYRQNLSYSQAPKQTRNRGPSL